MSRITSRLCWLVLAVLAAQGANAAQVQLAPGNGVWLKPASTPVLGNEAALIATLKARSLTHVFLWMTGFTSSRYADYLPFIQQAHSNGMTVHSVCATAATLSSGEQPSSVVLSNFLNEVLTYNGSHTNAPLDGVQIDVEAVTGQELLDLVSAVHVPESLVFSAAIQPEEFHDDVESAYHSLLQNTDLDMLIPMVYIMDGVGYRSGTNLYTFTVPGIATKTAQLLSLLPPQGRMMTGLSAYDLEYAVFKGVVGTRTSPAMGRAKWLSAAGATRFRSLFCAIHWRMRITKATADSAFTGLTATPTTGSTCSR